MHQSPYLQRKSHHYPLNRSLVRPLRRAADIGEIRHLALLWIEPRFLANTTVSLHQLIYPSCLVISMHSCSLKILHHLNITGCSATLHHVPWLRHWQKCDNEQTEHMRAAIMKQEARISHTDKYKICTLFTITWIPLVSNIKRLLTLQPSNYMLLFAFFWVFPRVLISYANVSKTLVCSIFIHLCRRNRVFRNVGI